MLPEEVKKATGDIKDPSMRVLVIILILAVMAIASVLTKFAGDAKSDNRRERELCETEKERLRKENDDLKSRQVAEEREDKIREREEKQKLAAWQDSVKNVLRNVIKTKK